MSGLARLHRKRSFATLWRRVRALFNRAGVTEELRGKLWPECASIATQLSNILSRKDGKSPFEKFYGKEVGYSHGLMVFGDIGVKLSKLYRMPEKLANKGYHRMFLGCAEFHYHDTHRVLDLKTQGVMLTRNAR